MNGIVARGWICSFCTNSVGRRTVLFRNSKSTISPKSHADTAGHAEAGDETATRPDGVLGRPRGLHDGESYAFRQDLDLLARGGFREACNRGVILCLDVLAISLKAR